MKEKYEFDTTKGLWWQMMWTPWTLEEYIQYLEEPKVLINPWRNVKLFDNWFFEEITQGPYWMTPVVTFPVAYYYWTQRETADYQESIITFLIGMVFWTFFEYSLHRFIFHGERYWVPDNQYAIACHFVLNGIHHAYPQDHRRTVFPWIPLWLILYPFMVVPM
jgi:4-hydroxysphinganine ceramide fatty acyl 2-hydroxylase